MVTDFIFDKQLSFEKRALKVFSYQYNQVEVYNTFCNHLNRTPKQVNCLKDIPFLPVEEFKYHHILSKEKIAQTTFRSSGTTGQIPSQHFIADLPLYEKSIAEGFEEVFGDPNQYCILALLPSYLERNDASLVYMANYLMQKSNHASNGFYLKNYDQLNESIQRLKQSGQKVILLGVTFALLDFAEKYPQEFTNISIIETGGMKGRRKEMTRNELHKQLKEAFQVKQIFSEYGMTEMLSQAYFVTDVFKPSTTLKCLVREITDPFSYVDYGKTGALNIIDLANYYSCSFIATQDIGKVYQDGSFEVLGRTDYSDLRGCNLMVL